MFKNNLFHIVILRQTKIVDNAASVDFPNTKQVITKIRSEMSDEKPQLEGPVVTAESVDEPAKEMAEKTAQKVQLPPQKPKIDQAAAFASMMSGQPGPQQEGFNVSITFVLYIMLFNKKCNNATALLYELLHLYTHCLFNFL